MQNGSFLCTGCGTDNIESPSRPDPRNAGYPGLDDPRFLIRNSADQVSKNLRVFPADRRDNRCLRLNHICCIQSSTQPRLDNDNVRFLFGKILEGQRCGCFKKCHFVAIDHLSQQADKPNDIRWRDRTAVDANSLAKRNEMRRCIEARSVPGSGKNCGNHSRGGSLSIRAGYMNRAEVAFRIAESEKQPANVPQTEFHSALLQSVQESNG